MSSAGADADGDAHGDAHADTDAGTWEEWAGEPGSRPFPDPEHSIAPRKPRTIGGAVYLGVLLAVVAGVVVAGVGAWRSGLTLVGGAMLLGAVARLVIPNRHAGMLGVRRKLVDVLTMMVLGGGLLVVAALVRPA